MATSTSFFVLLLLLTATAQFGSVLASLVSGLACAECQTMVKLTSPQQPEHEVANTFAALQGICYASADTQRCWAELASTTRIDQLLCSRLQICPSPDDILPQVRQALQLTDCEWCTSAIETIARTIDLAGNVSDWTFEHARLVEKLRDSCTQMPAHFVVQCQDSVTEQGPAMVDHLRDGNSAAQICVDAEFC